MTPATILVTDAGRTSALSIIRSLARQGFTIIAGDSQTHSLGFHSRYTTEAWHYPSPEESTDAFITALEAAIDDYHIDLIIPVTDKVVHPIAENLARIQQRCKVAIPDLDALEIVNNKSKTMALAQQLDIPIPKTILVQSQAEAAAAIAEFSWPIVMKPEVSMSYQVAADKVEKFEVSYATNQDELIARLEELGGRAAVLLQEYHAGSGEGVELLAYEGEILLAFQHKRLAEVPITGGASAWRQGRPVDPMLLQYSKSLVEALQWTGLIMVEFKVGEDARLMEINGRVWGSIPLAIFSGVDFPLGLANIHLLEDKADLTQGSSDNYTPGLHAYNLEQTLHWIFKVLFGKREYSFIHYPSRLEAVKPILWLLKIPWRIDTWSLDDPKPGFAEIAKIIRKFVRKIFS